MNDPIEVIVVEPHRGMRTSLSNVLSLEDDFHVAGRSADVLSAVRDASRTHADVAIVDDRLATLGAGPSAATIGALAKRLPVVVIGMGEPGLYTRPYLEAGAAGYWCKTASFDALTALLRETAAARRRAA